MYNKMLSFLDGRMEICHYLHFPPAAPTASSSLRERRVPPPAASTTNNHLSINMDHRSAELPSAPPTLNPLPLSERMRHGSVPWVPLSQSSAQDTTGQWESPSHFPDWKKAPQKPWRCHQLSQEEPYLVQIGAALLGAGSRLLVQLEKCP